jgi:diguanylate cyclase (GGDEF)-like protein
MLREMARIIQAQLREYDFLARYAGDEFVAVVQELAGSQVEELRTRIETAVSQFSLHVRADRRARVGISIGTATYGTDGETLDQLLIAADQAMYQVKSAHKVRQATGTSVPSERAASPQAELPAWVPGSDLDNQNLPPTSVN